MPGQKRWGVKKLEGFLAPLVKKGLKSVILFGIPEVKKDAKASEPQPPSHPDMRAYPTDLNIHIFPSSRTNAGH